MFHTIPIQTQSTSHSTHLCMTFDLCCDEIVKYLRKLCEVDVDQLSLEVETQERKEVAFLYFNQLVVTLYKTNTQYGN